MDDEYFSFFFESVSDLDLHHLVSDEKDYAVQVADRRTCHESITNTYRMIASLFT